jgi:flagellar protein FliO/FliZ
MMAGSAFTSAMWFIAIIVMIPLALWLLKRTPMGGATSQGLMRHVAALPISQNQRIVTVEVGAGDERRWLVLGITPQSITTLHAMAPQAEAPVAGPNAAPPFAQLLSKLRQDKGNARDR